MRTIQIKQQKSPSRVISGNGKSQGKQLKEFTDNRRLPIQRAEDLTEDQATMLERIRVICEQRLWTAHGKANQEVQVGLTGTGQLIIGYNHGVGHRLDQPVLGKQTLATLMAELNRDYREQITAAFGFPQITEIKIAKPTTSATSDFTVHAEISIMLFTLNQILQEIERTQTAVGTHLYIRGKKYTCGECKDFIRSFDVPLLQQCLKIHTPTKDLHLGTTLAGKDTGARGKVPKWHSPLDELSLSLKNAEARANSPEIQAFLAALKPYIDPEPVKPPKITAPPTVTPSILAGPSTLTLPQTRKRTTVSTSEEETKGVGKEYATLRTSEKRKAGIPPLVWVVGLVIAILATVTYMLGLFDKADTK